MLDRLKCDVVTALGPVLELVLASVDPLTAARRYPVFLIGALASHVVKEVAAHIVVIEERLVAVTSLP